MESRFVALAAAVFAVAGCGGQHRTGHSGIAGVPWYLVRAHGRQLRRFGQFSGDPHPGNFRLLADGRIAFLDFGTTKRVAGTRIDGELAVIRATLEHDANSVHAGLAALGFFESDDPRFDPALVLEHVRAINAWYADDKAITLSPQYVSALLAHAGDPRSKYWELMKNETIPAESLISSRMQVMTLAAIGQLNATANWHRIMSEWLYGSLPTSPLGLAEADFFELPSAPPRAAAA